jgi:hypothetical protein
MKGPPSSHLSLKHSLSFFLSFSLSPLYVTRALTFLLHLEFREKGAFEAAVEQGDQMSL